MLDQSRLTISSSFTHLCGAEWRSFKEAALVLLVLTLSPLVSRQSQTGYVLNLFFTEHQMLLVPSDLLAARNLPWPAKGARSLRPLFSLKVLLLPSHSPWETLSRFSPTVENLDLVEPAWLQWQFWREHPSQPITGVINPLFCFILTTPRPLHSSQTPSHLSDLSTPLLLPLCWTFSLLGLGICHISVPLPTVVQLNLENSEHGNWTPVTQIWKHFQIRLDLVSHFEPFLTPHFQRCLDEMDTSVELGMGF